MAMMTLQELKDISGHMLGKKGKAVQELEVSIRAKGNVTPGEDFILRLSTVFSNFTSTVFATAAIVLTSFSTDQGKVIYYASLHACAEFILGHKEEERLKMELANICAKAFLCRASDSTYMERLKEIEANNSEDKVKTISGQAPRSFGDLMEDPLACILGSPDSNMESDKPPEHKATILRRRDLRAQRRSQRHHHRHATL